MKEQVLFLLMLIFLDWVLVCLVEKQSRRVPGVVFHLLYGPGVICHELSHFLMAFIFGQKVEKIFLYRFEGRKDGITGYTNLRLRNPCVVIFISLSPLLICPVIGYFLWGSLQIKFGLPVTEILSQVFTWKNLLFLYFFTSICLSWLPSATDVEVAIKHWYGVLLAGIIVGFLGIVFIKMSEWYGFSYEELYGVVFFLIKKIEEVFKAGIAIKFFMAFLFLIVRCVGAGRQNLV